MRPISVKHKKTPRNIDTWATAFMVILVVAAIAFWAIAH